MNRGVVQLIQRNFNRALNDLNKAAECDSKNATIYYNLASLHSLQNQHDSGIDALDKALELGFSDCDALRKDPDLKHIRTRPEFRRLLEKYMRCFASNSVP